MKKRGQPYRVLQFLANQHHPVTGMEIRNGVRGKYIENVSAVVSNLRAMGLSIPNMNKNITPKKLMVASKSMETAREMLAAAK